MSTWRPVDLPEPGSPEYLAGLAEVLQYATDGDLTACEPDRHIRQRTYWWNGEDVTGEAIELIEAGLLDRNMLRPTPEGDGWLAGVSR